MDTSIKGKYLGQCQDQLREEKSQDEESRDEIKSRKNGHAVVKPVRKRYFILIMFVALSLIKSFQWIYLASITNVTTKFYQVDNIAINWTTVALMVSYTVLALPAAWLMDFIGLRNSVIVGTLGLTLGVIIKCFSCHRDGLLLNFVGHTIIAFAEPFIGGIYSLVASVWFPDD